MAGGVMAGAHACGLAAAGLAALAGWQVYVLAMGVTAWAWAGGGAEQLVREAGPRCAVALLSVGVSCECWYLCRELNEVVRGWCGIGERGVSCG